MPAVHIAAPDAAAGTRPCRIFISYAHADAQPLTPGRDDSMLRRLLLQLKNIRLELQGQGLLLHPDEIYLDRERANQVDHWEPAMEQAVAECRLVIFLVSSDSLGSDYCIPKEIEPALVPRADDGRPATVVPVLLHETDGWMHRKVGPHRLGGLHAGGLPKHPDNHNVTPIGSWANRDQAWAHVKSDLQKIILQRLFPGHGAGVHSAANGRPGAGLVDPRPPLPFLCNQAPQWQAFDRAAAQWNVQGARKTLLVMLQGVYDDELERFAERLSVHHLKPRLSTLPLGLRDGALVMEPPRVALAGLPPGMTMLQNLLAKLDETLYARLDRCRDDRAAAADLLREHLHARNDIVTVFCPLPPGGARDELQAFLRCLDDCRPQGNEMGRLVVYCLDELQPGAGPQGWASAGLASRWADVVVLDPLSDIDVEEARLWHRAHGLEDQLPRAALEALFQPPQAEPRRHFWPWPWSRPRAQAAPFRLRIRHFARRVGELGRGLVAPVPPP